MNHKCKKSVEPAALMDCPLIFYYHRLNTFSFNALAAALDRSPVARLPIALPTSPEQLQAILSNILEQRRRAIVALSIMTCQFEEMQRHIQWMRKQFGSRVVILAGGPHASACARDTLESGVDIVFRGEAEISFPIAVDRIARQEGYQGIPGIAYFRNKELLALPQPNSVDLDGLYSFSPGRGMFGPIEMTRGCPFACRYCQTSYIFGRSLRHRSIENIARQAAALRSGNRQVVRLLSPNAFSYGSADGKSLNLAALRELLSALHETVSPKGRVLFAHFPSEARPEHVTPETLELLREFADNDEIVIGAQSGSQRVLDICHRSHSVDHVLTAVTLARKYGYKIIVDFIYGLPGESEEDMRQSLKAMEEVVRLGGRIHAHLFAPLPQTPFANEAPGQVHPDIVNALEKLKSRQGVYENHRNTVRTQ
jgi:B12-binding domain/radical SAM domain protein